MSVIFKRILVFFIALWCFGQVFAQSLPITLPKVFISKTFNKVVPGAALMASGPAHAYSIRHINPAYVGPCMRIRRSNDNAELDINFNEFGYINFNEIHDFVSLNTAYVVKWYDQIGVNHLVNVGADTNEFPLIQKNGKCFNSITTGQLMINFQPYAQMRLSAGNVSTTNFSQFIVMYASDNNTQTMFGDMVNESGGGGTFDFQTSSVGNGFFRIKSRIYQYQSATVKNPLKISTVYFTKRSPNNFLKFGVNDVSENTPAVGGRDIDINIPQAAGMINAKYTFTTFAGQWGSGTRYIQEWIFYTNTTDEQTLINEVYQNQKAYFNLK